MPGTLLSFGHGYSAKALDRLLIPEGWRLIGTTRTSGNAAALQARGVEPLIFPGTDPAPAIEAATHILVSAGPDADGDPILRDAAPLLEQAAGIAWLGYLSTTGVYGDHCGDWVDESTSLAPSTTRGRRRVEAEGAWSALAARANLPLHIFRLAGIYGPGRGPFAKVRAGTARRIIKPGQVFSRIHVDDIAKILSASIARPNPGAIYNVCDDDPAPPQDVIAYAAELLGLPVPEAVKFEDAELTPMARSFYAESKRVRNDRMKSDLCLTLKYPDYRAGLRALLTEEKASAKA